MVAKPATTVRTEPIVQCLKDAQEFGIFRKFQQKLMYFSFHFHIKPHPLMVQYFSFDILKPTGPLPFTNISFL